MIKDLIKRHKVLFILCLFALIAVIVMLFAFLKMTVNTSGRYGDRLDGIEEVSISDDTLTDISSSLEEKEEVSEAVVRVQGKIIYVDITFTASTTLVKGKEIAASVVNEFSDDEQDFYDFSFIIHQENDEEEADTWASAGAKNAKDAEVSWTRS